MIILYGKPNCAKCQAAKEKLALLGLQYEERDLQAMVDGEGWRDEIDRRLELMAFTKLRGPEEVPVIEIDGGCYSYPEAMVKLKLKGGR